MQIRNGDVGLNVMEDGDPDAPPLVLLHGILSSTAAWNWLVPHVAASYRVLRLDFRGHGGSDRAPGTYYMPSFVSDAIALCEHTGVPCTVIGHSLGGGVAAALAQQRPDLVRAMVLEDPPLFFGENTGEWMSGNAMLEGFKLLRQLIPTLQQQDIPLDVLIASTGAAPGASGALMKDVLHPDGIEAMVVGMTRVDATVLDPVLDGIAVGAYDPDAPIPVPTLVLAADPASPDAVFRPADGEQLARVSAGTEVRVVAGASHLIHDELANRQDFLDAVLTFLARHSDARHRD